MQVPNRIGSLRILPSNESFSLSMAAKPNILIVAQQGRLSYEAILFVLSLNVSAPDFAKRLYIAEPRKGPLWSSDPRVKDRDIRALLAATGAKMVTFESLHFGEAYPNGNKIEALRTLPPGEPFIFFDTDTLIMGDLGEVPIDFSKPSASLRREGTWPKLELYGPGYHEIWASLYAKFGMDVDTALDPTQPLEYWMRYPYYNAGWFYYSCPEKFGTLYEKYAVAIRNDPPKEIVCQSLDPWLDQVALPLVIHKLGGGPSAMQQGYFDGKTSLHYRYLSLLYAKEPDTTIAFLEALAAPNPVKKILKQYEPFKWFIYQNKGKKARELFDRNDLPRAELAMRKKLKNRNLWVR